MYSVEWAKARRAVPTIGVCGGHASLCPPYASASTVSCELMLLSSSVAPLEKVPLETYVPPAKPSLIGLSRAEAAQQVQVFVALRVRDQR